MERVSGDVSNEEALGEVTLLLQPGAIGSVACSAENKKEEYCLFQAWFAFCSGAHKRRRMAWLL